MENEIRIKFRLIYLPFLYYTLAFVLGYTFLNWFLFVNHPSFLLKEKVRNFFIPMALPWIPIYIWYRPRIKILRFNASSRNPIGSVFTLVCFTIIGTMIIAQKYMSTASGKLTLLKKIQDINISKDTRYYIIDHYIIDRNYHAWYFKKELSGKYSQNLDLTLYIVCPLYDSAQLPSQDDKHYPITDKSPLFFINGEISDSTNAKKIPTEMISSVSVLKGASAFAYYGKAGKNGVILINTKKEEQGVAEESSKPLPDSLVGSTTIPDTEPAKIGTINKDTSNIPLIWVGMKYSKRIDNHSKPEEKIKLIKEFQNTSWSDYVQLPTKGYKYFDKIPYSDDYELYNIAAQYKKRYNKKAFHLMVAKDNPFDKRNGQKLPWIFGVFTIGSLILLLVLLLTPLDETKATELLQGEL